MLYLGKDKVTIGYKKTTGNVVLQSKEVTPTTSKQTITADGSFNGLSSVVVNAIPSEYIIPSGTKNIVANANNINVKAYEFVNVNVDGATAPTTEEKIVTPTKAVQEIVPSEGVDYLSKVTVGAIPNEYIVPSGTLEINSNGTYNCTDFQSVNVNVENGTASEVTKGVIFENYQQGSISLDGGTVTPRRAVIVGYNGEKIVDYLCTTFGRGLLTDNYFFSKINEIVINCLPTEIGKSTFEDCRAITTINIPDSVETIGKNAFESCYNLVNVSMNKVKVLSNYCFKFCKNLTNITIPNTIEEIQAYVFDKSSGDSKITINIKATTPPVIYTTSFNSNFINKIIVPKGTKQAYDVATNWILLKDLIEEEA